MALNFKRNDAAGAPAAAPPPAAAAPAPAPAYSFAGVRSANQKQPRFNEGEFLCKVLLTATNTVPMKGVYFVAEFEIVESSNEMNPEGSTAGWVRDISDPQKWGMGSREIKAFTRAVAGFDSDEAFHEALGEADANALCAQVMADGSVLAGELVRVVCTPGKTTDKSGKVYAKPFMNLSFYPAPKANEAA